MEASVVSTFFVVFREALEASLIVGIILTVLARLKAMRYVPHVTVSVLAAGGASLLVAWGMESLIGILGKDAEKILEGLISLLACVVLTYMVFWMDKQARRIRPEIETKLEAAVSNSELIAIITLPFIAVLREGFETVLFLKAVAIQSSGSVSFWGGISGFALAVLITAAIFVGGKRVPLKPLFQWTGYFLLLVAGGLLAYGIHELHEANWIPPVIDPIWNINHILNDKEGVGLFLKALFGYNGNPSLVEVTAYGLYFIFVLIFLKKGREQAATV